MERDLLEAERIFFLIAFGFLFIVFVFLYIKNLKNLSSIIDLTRVPCSSRFFGLLSSAFFTVRSIDGNSEFGIYSMMTGVLLNDLGLAFLLFNFMFMLVLSYKILNKLNKTKISFFVKYVIILIPSIYVLYVCAVDIVLITLNNKFDQKKYHIMVGIVNYIASLTTYILLLIVLSRLKKLVNGDTINIEPKKKTKFFRYYIMIGAITVSLMVGLARVLMNIIMEKRLEMIEVDRLEMLGIEMAMNLCYVFVLMSVDSKLNIEPLDYKPKGDKGEFVSKKPRDKRFRKTTEKNDSEKAKKEKKRSKKRKKVIRSSISGKKIKRKIKKSKSDKVDDIKRSKMLSFLNSMY